MVRTKKNIAPFGSNVKRFGKITVHPKLDSAGLYTDRPKGCDPALYSPISTHVVYNNVTTKIKSTLKQPWQNKSELEDWSKNLGFRNQEILNYRWWYLTVGGPAWQEVFEPAKYEAACRNVGFGRTPRFKPFKNKIPGPGTYYQASPYKTPYGPHSTKPHFEREEPCRFKDMSPKWSLAPNRYTILDKDTIEKKPKKIVSLRGPYDLFTGKRDGSTIKNHFNTSLKCSAATWPLALPGGFENIKKTHLGVMNKTGRNIPYRGRNALVDLAMCLRKPEHPGPAHLNIDKPKVFKQNKFGFSSSYDRPPGYQRTIIWPGVGRYKPHVSCGIIGHGHKHVFLSKQGRTIGAVLPQPMNSF